VYEVRGVDGHVAVVKVYSSLISAATDGGVASTSWASCASHLSVAKLSVALSPHYLSHDREAGSVSEPPDVTDRSVYALWVVQTLRAAPFSVAISRQIVWRFTVLLDALGRPLELVWERVTVADLDESAAGPRQSRGPVGETERIIADLWESVLSVQDVRVDQNFFELGDSSLTAAALLAAVESRFSLRLPFTAVMSHPTVASFATMVGDAVGFGAPPRPTISPLLVPLQTRGTLPSFFGVHPLFGLVYPYVELARHLSADQPLCPASIRVRARRTSASYDPRFGQGIYYGPEADSTTGVLLCRRLVTWESNRPGDGSAAD